MKPEKTETQDAGINDDYVYVFEDDLGDDYLEMPAATDGEVEATVDALLAAGAAVDAGTVTDGDADTTVGAAESTVESTDGQAVTDTSDAGADTAGVPDTSTQQDDYEVKLAAMRATMEAQAAELMALRSTAKQASTPVQGKPAATPVVVVEETNKQITPRTVDDFMASIAIDADGLDAIVTSPEGFNAHIQKVLTAYDAFAVPKLVEQVFLSLPAMVTHQIEVQAELNKEVEKFYAGHPILKDHQNIVASNIHVIRGENPEMTRDQCLAEAAKRSYTQLGILEKQGLSVTTTQQAAIQQAPKVASRAALPGRQTNRFGGGGRVTVDPSLRKELDEL